MSPQKDLFLVRRTSFFMDNKPCDEAFEIDYISDFHRSVGYEKGWAVIVPDIVEFVNKHGKCIIFPADEQEKYPIIEIYDDHRE